MSKTPYKVYVIQGRGQRDYADCQAALAHVPAHVETLTFIGDAAEVIERTRDADALIVTASPITRRVMEALEGLKVVVRGGVGYDDIDVPAATELGVVVVNIPDLWIREVANHALALLLAWNRKIVTLDREIRAGVWNSRVPGATTGALHGETVGVVGLGNIGSSFARRVAALETRVIACDPYVDDARFAALGVERVGLEDLASRADYVSVHTLLNAETRHLIGESFFNRMKPTALLINTSRGPVVDERALIRALQERAAGGGGARRLRAGADGGRQSAPAHGQRHRHAACRLLLLARRRPDPAALREEVARVLTNARPLHVVNPDVYAPGHHRRSAGPERPAARSAPSAQLTLGGPEASSERSGAWERERAGATDASRGAVGRCPCSLDLLEPPGRLQTCSAGARRRVVCSLPMSSTALRAPEQSAGETAIPVIDLGAYLAGAHGALEATAAALRDALEGIGFFIIVNHGVPRDLIAQTFAEAKRFHDQPLTPRWRSA